MRNRSHRDNSANVPMGPCRTLTAPAAFRISAGFRLVPAVLLLIQAIGAQPVTPSTPTGPQDVEEKFLNRVMGLQEELKDKSACRFGDLADLQTELETLRKEAMGGWESHYSDSILSETRMTELIKEDLAALPAAIAKLNARLAQVVKDSQDADRRLAVMDSNSNLTGPLLDARKKLQELSNTLKSELKELGDRRKEVEEGREVLVIQKQAGDDVRKTLESLKSRKGLKLDRFFDLAKLKILAKRAECRFTP